MRWGNAFLKTKHKTKTSDRVEPKKDSGAQLLIDSQRVLLVRIVLATFRSLGTLSHEPLGSSVNPLQSLTVRHSNGSHCRQHDADGVQRRYCRSRLLLPLLVPGD
jgi:hypothetical protein